MIRKRGRSVFSAMDEILEEMESKEDGQLSLPFGPPPEYTIMFQHGSKYAREVRLHLAAESESEAFGFILARPRSIDIRPDGDGDYRISQLDVSKVVTTQEIWEMAQANPDMSFEDFMSQRFMEAQMGL